MTTETSRNATYAPYAQWAAAQAPVPQTVHNLPATIAAGATVSTSLIKADGYSLIAAGLIMNQPGSLQIQRYLDDGGTVAQGAVASVPLGAGAVGNLDLLDGKPFASFVLSVTNAGGASATIGGFALLLQATPAAAASTAVDGSAAIAAGGTAQPLFGGAVPANGFLVVNPDPANDLWISMTATAAANGQGSIRIACNGGYFASEPGLKPPQAVSAVGAVTGQKLTAARW